jgi:hypothetical protein
MEKVFEPHYEGLQKIDLSQCVDCDDRPECGGAKEYCESVGVIKVDGIYKTKITMGHACLRMGAFTQEHQDTSDAAMNVAEQLCVDKYKTLSGNSRPLVWL